MSRRRTSRRISRFLPVRDLPIRMRIDGVSVEGKIAFLAPNDMIVVITAPFTGFRTGTHVPYFAMQPENRLATAEGLTTRQLTANGRRRAERLLRCLYDHARGIQVDWPIERTAVEG